METLGTLLKTSRVNQKLTIEEISQKLKIRNQVLNAFEEDKYDILPSVYARSSLKSYGTFLKIEPSVLNSMLDELFIAEKPTYTAQPANEYESLKSEITDTFKKSLYKLNLSNDNKGKIVNYLIYAGIVLSLVVLIYFSIFSDSSKTGISYTSDKESTAKEDSSNNNSQSNGLLSFFEKPDSINLEARAIDTSWLRIDIDGKKPEIIHMAPNVTKRWTAEKYFLLTVGNVGSIEFRRDGSVLKPFGTKGSVVRNVKITKSEVISSSLPWSEVDTSKFRKKVIKKEKEEPQIKMLEPSTLEPYKPFEDKKKEPR
ncbi:MAG: helix-turn-helix domain-containing protein [Bacteroidetes bacterium]|nr:MAG: helix-turn-helix domain-containing protein [Bacteroidota bacterium]